MLVTVQISIPPKAMGSILYPHLSLLSHLYQPTEPREVVLQYDTPYQFEPSSWQILRSTEFHFLHSTYLVKMKGDGTSFQVAK